MLRTAGSEGRIGTGNTQEACWADDGDEDLSSGRLQIILATAIPLKSNSGAVTTSVSKSKRRMLSSQGLYKDILEVLERVVLPEA
jgi:hypothetical protein